MTTVNGHHPPTDVDPDADLPPSNIEAERALLGALLLVPLRGTESDTTGHAGTVRAVADTVTADDFYRPAHQDIYTVITAMHQRGDPVDAILVAHELARRNQLLRIGGAPYLHGLLEAVTTAANAAYHAELVAEAATRRRLQQLGQHLLQLSRHLDSPVDDLLQRARSTVDRLVVTASGAGNSRLVLGGSFIHDAPTKVPALWGDGDDVLWAEDEPLMICGPTGVGKTTLGGQLVEARLGLRDTVLGYPVQPGRRLLYLAMDRPAQISRALRRRLGRHDRTVLDERLVVWKGPPAADLAKNPDRLLDLTREAGADSVVIDSLKDAAVKLSDEETGQGLNAAMQLCVANHVQVLALHHQRKAGAGGQGKPNTLADVYGSGWLTAGAGSVLLLWGSAGDPVVELSHLKQPAAEVGPLRILHDPHAGTSSLFDPVDLVALLGAAPRSAREVAMEIYSDGGPVTDSQVEKARRRLDRMVEDDVAVRLDDPVSGGRKGGGQGARYALAARPDVQMSW